MLSRFIRCRCAGFCRGSLLSRRELRFVLRLRLVLRWSIFLFGFFALPLLDKILFGLLFDGITSSSRHTLAAALYFVSSITHRVFLARCVAFFLLLVFLLDDGCGLLRNKAGSFHFRFFQGAFFLNIGHGVIPRPDGYSSDGTAPCPWENR